ncbi:ABC transporter permease [Pigmentiphaga soli]|uniref:ABC transporter permease n=1 Tax=Pigmentiphaga soli TaxID=1007095 RepID=A0ABP8GPL3_9BURK
MSRRGASTAYLAWPAVAVLTVLFLVPLAAVLAISVTDPQPGLGNYRLLLESRASQAIFLKTAQIGVIVTLLATAFGYLIAFAMIHGQRRWQTVILAGVLIPLWSSVLIRAFAWVTLLRSNGLVNQALMAAGIVDMPLELMRNDVGVVIGMVHVMIPLATLPIYSVMRGIDRRLVSAARTLGASETRAMLEVFAPLTLPGVAAAAVLVFVTSIGFYVIPAVLGGGKTVMIAEYIEVQINSTLRWGLGTMLAAVLLAAVGCLFAIGARIPALRQRYGG